MSNRNPRVMARKSERRDAERRAAAVARSWALYLAAEAPRAVRTDAAVAVAR
jgi:hypothetical protein